jgi:hypothetical protein
VIDSAVKEKPNLQLARIFSFYKKSKEYMGLLIIIYGWYDFYKLIQGMFWFFFN